MSEADSSFTIAAGTGFDEELTATVKEAVWAFLATAAGRQPHVRVLHPVWEGRTIWMATRTSSAKLRQLARNPRAELFYWTNTGRHLTITGTCTPVDAPAEKQRLRELFKQDLISGYDLALIWPDAADPGLTFIRLEPARIEAFSAPDLARGIQPRRWPG